MTSIPCTMRPKTVKPQRSEEHTSELQSPCNLVCRLLLEKKNDGIETHFVNDRFDLKCIARKQSHAPFRVVEACRTRDELFYLAGELASNRGVSFPQFAALVIRQGIPIALLSAPFAHVIKANNRPIGQCRINALLPVMFHSLAKCCQGLIEFCLIVPHTGLKRLRVFVFACGVFAFLRKRHITVNRT